MRRVLREPLLHFFLLGALLFWLYGRVSSGGGASRGEIVVDGGRLASIDAQFERVWQRPPTADERAGLIDDWIREEILYREGVAMGLERDDPVVRRRIAQKMTFVADGLAPAAPSEAELQAWLEAHPDDYRVEPVYSLRQVFFDPAKHGERLEADLAAARRALATAAPQDLGDTTLLPASLQEAAATEVGRIFGPEFADALDALAVGRWEGPVRSSYGVHLVELSRRTAARLPTLAEARDAVERDLSAARAAEASEALYRSLRARYAVRIETDPEAAAR